ncbi:MAG: SRPBCC domain-containing protein [Bdellovibrionales bacterium]
MKTTRTPDLSKRAHTMTIERLMKASADDIYEAWTRKFDIWFAQPGELIMSPEVDRPYFFYNRHDWGRHAHYGRFLELQKGKLVEMTWVTGKGGTFGAETVLKIELTPEASGTRLRLTHSGFEDEKSRDAHKAAWPEALEVLDKALQR